MGSPGDRVPRVISVPAVAAKEAVVRDNVVSVGLFVVCGILSASFEAFVARVMAGLPDVPVNLTQGG